MSILDTITSPALQQQKTEIAVITMGIVNGVNSLAFHTFGWQLPDAVLNLVNGGLALLIALALAARTARTENKVDAVAANQTNPIGDAIPVPATPVTGAPK